MSASLMQSRVVIMMSVLTSVVQSIVHVRWLIFVNVLNGEQSVWMVGSRPDVNVTLGASGSEVLVLQLL